MAAVRRPKKLEAEALWNYALYLLGVRPHSAGQLRQKLARRAESLSDIPAVMAKLSEYNLTDDRKFSETFASSRVQNQGFGRFRVLRELRSKQVSATIAETAVATTFAGTDETELAGKFLERKYRCKDLPVFLAEEKNLASAYRRLRTGGFSSGAAVAVLKRYSQRREDWSDVEAEEEPIL